MSTTFRCRFGREPLLRVLVALLVLGSVAGRALPASAIVAQPSEAEEILDLAAMTLTPADLDDAGLEGYGVGFGKTEFLDGYAAASADFREASEDEVREVLEEAGFVRYYESDLFLPADEDDPAGAAQRAVVSYVLEFADAAGAADAWDFLEDETILDPTLVESTEDVELSDEFGDESEATLGRFEDPATGEPYDMLDLAFRLGRLYAGVAIFDWQGEEPATADAEALAERLLERVEAVRDEGEAGLGSRVVRLSGDEVAPWADYYVIVDGEAVALYGEAPADARAREGAAADIDQTDGYRLWQLVAPGGEDPEDDVWYLVEAMGFADEDAAADWLAGTEDRIEGNTDFVDLEVDDGAPTFGDESLAYTLATADGSAHYRSVGLRVGTTVVYVDVSGPEMPPADAVEALAEAQDACLQDGGCREPLDLPEALVDFVAGLGVAVQEDDDEDATPDPDADGTRPDWCPVAEDRDGRDSRHRC